MYTIDAYICTSGNCRYHGAHHFAISVIVHDGAHDSAVRMRKQVKMMAKMHGESVKNHHAVFPSTHPPPASMLTAPLKSSSDTRSLK